MSSNAALKRSPCAKGSTRQTKTSRVESLIVLEPTTPPRFTTFEALDSFRKAVWGEAVKSGEYKLYVIVLFLWAARVAGSSFDESGVYASKSLYCRLFLLRYDHPLCSTNVPRPFARLHRKICPGCEILPVQLLM